MLKSYHLGAYRIFSLYQKVGAVAMLEIAENLIAQALGQPRMLEADLPRSGRATLRRQAEQARDVLHLLSANPVLRGQLRGNPVQPIQDLIPLYNVAVSVPATGPATVRLVPEGTEITSTFETGRLSFTVPEIRGHRMVEIGCP